MHPDALPQGEKAPPLTGMDRVLKENLYGNLRFPQVGFAIVAYTLHALVTDENPKQLIKDYLTTELSEEQLSAMLEKAERAHAAYLPEEKRPELTTQRMRELWEEEREYILSFFAGLLHIPTGYNEITLAKLSEEEILGAVLSQLEEKELPLETLKICAGKIIETLKEPSVVEALKEYRDLFRENSSQSPVVVKAQGEISTHALKSMLEKIDAHDPRIDNKTLQAFCRVVSREL